MNYLGYWRFERSHFGVYFLVEAEKKWEAKQRAKEAQERELRKREKNPYIPTVIFNPLYL